MMVQHQTGVLGALAGSGVGTLPTPSDLANWLDGWVQDRLVFGEGGRYVSLAIDSLRRVMFPGERFLALLDADG